jgi:uncharacterized protein GlcG (DUF336 family)
MRNNALRFIVALAASAWLIGCSGSSGGGGGGAAMPPPPVPQAALAAAEVEIILAQAVVEAQARGAKAHVAVVDRVGNVLGVFSMNGAPATVAIKSGLGVVGGLDGIPEGVVPATYSAISKAITGAYLSSQGNAFSTRTAGQIVQEHFNPGESRQPAGPLYGVQFSQLSCSDVMLSALGPRRSPLGLSADPGGLPIYKNGVLVGGIGIEANGLYGLDRNVGDIDQDVEELIAVAGVARFRAPEDIRGNRITADGRTFRYVDSEAILTASTQAPALASLPGSLVAVDSYTTAILRGGVTFGTPASGIRAAGVPFDSAGPWILVDDANNNRYPARSGFNLVPGDLAAPEVQVILAQAFAIAQRARAQIRRPLGSNAQVSIAVVDPSGNVLGLVRTADAPVFGIDVAVQKARTAMFFSREGAYGSLQNFSARHLVPAPAFVLTGQYGDDARAFLGNPSEFNGGTAWSARAIGNLHRPFYPDGVDGAPRGPFSTPIERWSPFNVGLQLDLVYNAFIRGIQGTGPFGCVGVGATYLPPPFHERPFDPLRNGIQIFPGAVPIYRDAQLIGAIGVSGDGVDQDDMIAFLGLANAGRALGGAVGNAPPQIRADKYAPLGVRLRYVQCPQAPFIDSTEQNVCEGI